MISYYCYSYEPFKAKLIIDFIVIIALIMCDIILFRHDNYYNYFDLSKIIITCNNNNILLLLLLLIDFEIKK